MQKTRIKSELGRGQPYSIDQGVKIYTRISSLLALELCFHAGIFYLIHGNNFKVGGDGFFEFPMAIFFAFAFYNGILMTIAGIYLLLKGTRPMGWATLVAVLIFYLTAFLIHVYGRTAG